jgi:hypothetical protein
MKKSSKIYKVLLTFFVFGFVIWFGGTLVRTTIAYDLFIPGIEMELKPQYTNDIRMQNIYLFSITALLTGITYSIAVISGVILAFLSRKEFKEKGWLFMAFCLFLLTIPIQIYYIYMDLKLAQAVYFQAVKDFFHPAIQEYFVQRFLDVKNTSLRTIMLLSALTCMLYSIWRPLEKKTNGVDENT